MIALADQFEGAVGSIVERVSQASAELEACSAALSETAQTTQQLTMTVTAASEQASGNVEAVAGATEEMSSSVNEISRQVHESSRIANEAVRAGGKTDSRIAELTQAATRIGDVVALITAIAEQTNLLALNATIEAARAGEAGRGFAVVASEVKQLASQTAKATEEIGTQVAGMQAATNESVAAIKEIGGTIGRISEIATMIAAAVEEQDSVTKDIARNVEQAAGRHLAGRLPYRRGQSRRERDRLGLRKSSDLRAIAFGREQPPQARSREIPRHRARGLTRLPFGPVAPAPESPQRTREESCGPAFPPASRFFVVLTSPPSSPARRVLCAPA